MAALHLEVEKKYVADDAFELPSLTALVRGPGDERAASDVAVPLAEGESVHQRLTATYFDTDDLRLAAAGLTLRRRTGGDDAGWHLKVPAGSGARTEVRLPAGRAGIVPDELRKLVRAHSGDAALRPIAEIVTQRTMHRLVDPTGQVLAELADDRVTARRLMPLEGSGEAAGAETSWREVEVELVAGEAELLDGVDARLRAGGLRPSGDASKLAHLLGTNGTGTTERRALLKKAKRLTTKSGAGEVLLAHLHEQVAQVRAQDMPVRLDAPDAVHKMRVATRRLRSALSTFRPLFAKEVVRPLRGELKWLAGELGAARDAEVMRDRVSEAVRADEGGVEHGTATAIADQELGQAYRSAHDRVLAELDGERYHHLVAALDELVGSPPFTQRAARPAGKALPKLVARSYSGVRALVEDAAARPAGDEREELLHDARKAAKASRYAGESVDRVFGEDAAAFARAMEAVQEALGEHQDSVLTRRRLHDLAQHTSSTEAAFLYGRLHALEEARAEQSQRHFDDAWQAAGRKSLHRWLR